MANRREVEAPHALAIRDTSSARNLKKLLASIGGSGAVITIFELIDKIFTLNDIYAFLVDNWATITNHVWTWVALYILGIPKLAPLDALFLTFMLFISLSIVSSVRRHSGTQTQSHFSDYIKGISSFLILVAVFALGDIATTSETMDRSLGFGTIQSYLLSLYNAWINPFLGLATDLPKCVARFPDMFLFYAFVAGTWFLVILLLLRLLGLDVQINVLASRLAVIVLTSTALLAVNLITLAAWKGNTTGLFVGCAVT